MRNTQTVNAANNLFQHHVVNVRHVYSRTCLERPPLVPSKSGLSRQVVSHNRSYKHQLETNRAYENGLSRRVVAYDTEAARDRFYCNYCHETIESSYWPRSNYIVLYNILVSKTAYSSVS